MVYRHKESKDTYGRMGGNAKNTVSGADKGNKKFDKYAQDWDRESGALEKTPYSMYQNSIQNRNTSSVKKNLNDLKQD